MMKKKIIGVDESVLFHSLVFAMQKSIDNPAEPTDSDLSKFQNMYLYKILKYIKQFKCNYNRPLVLALDNARPYGYWRKQFMAKIIKKYFNGYYSDKELKDIDYNNLNYKMNRKNIKKKSDINWKAFYKLKEKLTEFLKNYTDVIVIEVKRTEADDIFHWLQYYADEYVIVGNDSDLFQIKKAKHYNAIKKRYINATKIKNFDIRAKFIKGDRKDNIFGLKKGIGEVTANKIINAGIDDYLDDNPEILFRYKVNEKILDLSKAPKFIKKEICSEIESALSSQYNYNQMEILTFITRNKLSNIVKSIQHFKMSNNKNKENLFSL